MLNNEKLQGIGSFYNEAASNFLEWSPDPKRIGLYFMHIGYQNWQEPVSNPVSALQMSQKIIELSQVKPGQMILDAGCGVGNLTFEIVNTEPKAKTFGIDILENHIHLANRYNQYDGSPNPVFSTQDYEHTAFRNRTFDRIVLCESFIHSQDKKSLIQESNRILKPKGRITIADIFMHTDILTEEEVDLMGRLKTYMYIPNITHVQELIALLSTSGFACINPRDITANVTAPADYYDYSLKRQKSDEESSPKNIGILLTGLQRLLREGKAGYYIVTAQKNQN